MYRLGIPSESKRGAVLETKLRLNLKYTLVLLPLFVCQFEFKSVFWFAYTCQQQMGDLGVAACLHTASAGDQHWGSGTLST